MSIFSNPATRQVALSVALACLAPALGCQTILLGGRQTKDGGQVLVKRLDIERFKQNIEILAGFGTRHWNQQGNARALGWIEAQLRSFGYTVERHNYRYEGEERYNLYVTKVGTKYPDWMGLISAHMDSFNTQNREGGFAPGADDDASGTSLVLEAARVFASPDVHTEYSVRFIFWNNEETGLDGSKAYVRDRQELQGIEDPPGSGLYPEPNWVGIVQHDMILFDHGLPPQKDQIAAADIDVEYRDDHDYKGRASLLAKAIVSASERYAKDYPAEIGKRMANTDSQSFWDACAAVSIRENRRLEEIGKGANPNWHKNSDVPETYSDADYLLGFNTVQMSVGAAAEISRATIGGS